jgi:hypothetical protein
MPLPDYGDYAFNVYVGDSKLLKTVMFTVMKPPTGMQLPGGKPPKA